MSVIVNGVTKEEKGTVLCFLQEKEAVKLVVFIVLLLILYFFSLAHVPYGSQFKNMFLKRGFLG